MRRLLFLLLLLPTSAFAQAVCLESPNGYYTCESFIARDGNALPTPQPNAISVTGNNGAGTLPTPAAETCRLYDVDDTATTDCILTDGTTTMHIPPLNSELPEVKVTTQTSTPYTADATQDEVILCDATAAAITVNLPAAATAGAGRRYVVKRINTNSYTCTVDGNGAETIDGDTTKVLTSPYSAIPIVTDGSNWFVY
jgi:hypothetical protein